MRVTGKVQMGVLCYVYVSYDLCIAWSYVKQETKKWSFVLHMALDMVFREICSYSSNLDNTLSDLSTILY